MTVTAPRIARRRLLAVALALALFGAFASTARAAGEVPYEPTRFEADLDLGRPVALLFAADWCSTCSAEKAVLEELLAEPRFRELTVFVADYDAERALRRTYRVVQQSTIIVFKNGHEAGRAIGLVRKDALGDLLAKAL
jgi:thiol-disulfide isomerase/thioredoxin